MNIISLEQWPCLLLDQCTQVAGSSQPPAVDNDGPCRWYSEDDEASDQEDEEEEAVEVSFPQRRWKSAFGSNTMALINCILNLSCGEGGVAQTTKG